MGIFRKAPPEFLREQYKRQLLPGTVIKIEELMDDGKLKGKLFVVVSVYVPNVNCFIINSDIGPFIQARPKMLACQALMPVATHPFMKRDSHIDCYRPWSFDFDHVISELVNSAAQILGRITLPMRDEVVAKLMQSAATTPQEKTSFASSLNTMT